MMQCRSRRACYLANVASWASNNRMASPDKATTWARFAYTLCLSRGERGIDIGEDLKDLIEPRDLEDRADRLL
jgi:hypothetical protein